MLLRFRFCVGLMVAIGSTSTTVARNEETPLSPDELRLKYGQENTTKDDGKSCYRTCNGVPKTCYFEFVVEYYDTMSQLCGDCANGTISDCFNKGCLPANGVERIVMTVNRKLPGPPMNVCKNDRIIVDVTNHMAGSDFAMHWHGLHQKDTPWSDGVPMVTQCPITSGNTFRYLFTASESGSMYYHAHSGLHRSNGCFGVMTVRNHEDPNASFYDYDLSEHSVLVFDWNNQLAEETSPAIKFSPTRPDSLLINGFGSHFDKTKNQFTNTPMAVFYAQRGKRYRFRVDNSATHMCGFEVSVQGFNMTVIASDSYSVEPLTVEAIITSAGERYDFVLHAPEDQNIDETLMVLRGQGLCEPLKLQEFARIIFVDDYSTHQPKYDDHTPLAHRPPYESLNYRKITLNHPQTACGSPHTDSYCIADLKHKMPESSPGSGNLRNLSHKVKKVIPFLFRTFMGKETVEENKTAGNAIMVNMINNIASTHFPIPGLTQDDSNVPYCNAENKPSNCDQSVCHCPHLVELDMCEVYDFLFICSERVGNPVSHPIHLHGYGFQVIDMGTKEQLETGKTPYANATALPVIKDTVVVPSGGFVRIRFNSCNPGYWVLHCHFEYHMHTGMVTTIKVGNKTDMVPPPPNFPTCGNYLPAVFDSSKPKQSQNTENTKHRKNAEHPPAVPGIFSIE